MEEASGKMIPAKQIDRVAEDPCAYSTRNDLHDKTSPYRGALVPALAFRMCPLELQGPSHSQFRKATKQAIAASIEFLSGASLPSLDQARNPGDLAVLFFEQFLGCEPGRLCFLGSSENRQADLEKDDVAAHWAAPHLGKLYSAFATEVSQARSGKSRPGVLATLKRPTAEGGEGLADNEAMAIGMSLVIHAFPLVRELVSAALVARPAPEQAESWVEHWLSAEAPLELSARTADAGVVGAVAERLLIDWSAQRGGGDDGSGSLALGTGPHRCLGGDVIVRMAALTSEVAGRSGAGDQ